MFDLRCIFSNVLWCVFIIIYLFILHVLYCAWVTLTRHTQHSSSSFCWFVVWLCIFKQNPMLDSERAQTVFCLLRAVVCYLVTLLLFAHTHTRCCNRRYLKGIMHKIKAIFCHLELIYGRHPTYCCSSESGLPGQQDSFIIYWASESRFSLSSLV